MDLLTTPSHQASLPQRQPIIAEADIIIARSTITSEDLSVPSSTLLLPEESRRTEIMSIDAAVVVEDISDDEGDEEASFKVDDAYPTDGLSKVGTPNHIGRSLGLDIAAPLRDCIKADLGDGLALGVRGTHNELLATKWDHHQFGKRMRFTSRKETDGNAVTHSSQTVPGWTYQFGDDPESIALLASNESPSSLAKYHRLSVPYPHVPKEGELAPAESSIPVGSLPLTEPFNRAEFFKASSAVAAVTSQASYLQGISALTAVTATGSAAILATQAEEWEVAGSNGPVESVAPAAVVIIEAAMQESKLKPEADSDPTLVSPPSPRSPPSASVPARVPTAMGEDPRGSFAGVPIGQPIPGIHASITPAKKEFATAPSPQEVPTTAASVSVLDRRPRRSPCAVAEFSIADPQSSQEEVDNVSLSGIAPLVQEAPSDTERNEVTTPVPRRGLHGDGAHSSHGARGRTAIYMAGFDTATDSSTIGADEADVKARPLSLSYQRELSEAMAQDDATPFVSKSDQYSGFEFSARAATAKPDTIEENRLPQPALGASATAPATLAEVIDHGEDGLEVARDRHRRPSMASPIPGDGPLDSYKITDDEFASMQNFDWSSTRTEILSDLEFISHLPTHAALDYEAVGPSLPPKDRNAPVKSLFLDLDETMAHTALGDVVKPRTPDLLFSSEGDGAMASVYFRPWIHDFLKVAAQYFEIILYTASLKPYADLIVDELDTDHNISHRLYREHCTQYGGTDIFFKDIHGTGRAVEDSIVVDNRLISFGLNLDNGIFVSSYTGQADDTELLHLIPLLIALSRQSDVRVSLMQTYRLSEILEKFRMDHLHLDSDDMLAVKDERLLDPNLTASILSMGTAKAHSLSGITGGRGQNREVGGTHSSSAIVIDEPSSQNCLEDDAYEPSVKDAPDERRELSERSVACGEPWREDVDELDRIASRRVEEDQEAQETRCEETSAPQGLEDSPVEAVTSVDINPSFETALVATATEENEQRYHEDLLITNSWAAPLLKKPDIPSEEAGGSWEHGDEEHVAVATGELSTKMLETKGKGRRASYQWQLESHEAPIAVAPFLHESDPKEKPLVQLEQAHVSLVLNETSREESTSSERSSRGRKQRPLLSIEHPVAFTAAAAAIPNTADYMVSQGDHAHVGSDSGASGRRLSNLTPMAAPLNPGVGSRSSQRSYSRHLSALGKMSPAVVPEEPKNVPTLRRASQYDLVSPIASSAVQSVTGNTATVGMPPSGSDIGHGGWSRSESSGGSCRIVMTLPPGAPTRRRRVVGAAVTTNHIPFAVHTALPVPVCPASSASGPVPQLVAISRQQGHDPLGTYRGLPLRGQNEHLPTHTQPPRMQFGTTKTARPAKAGDSTKWKLDTPLFEASTKRKHYTPSPGLTKDAVATPTPVVTLTPMILPQSARGCGGYDRASRPPQLPSADSCPVGCEGYSFGDALPRSPLWSPRSPGQNHVSLSPTLSASNLVSRYSVPASAGIRNPIATAGSVAPQQATATCLDSQPVPTVLQLQHRPLLTSVASCSWGNSVAKPPAANPSSYPMVTASRGSYVAAGFPYAPAIATSPCVPGFAATPRYPPLRRQKQPLQATAMTVQNDQDILPSPRFPSQRHFSARETSADSSLPAMAADSSSAWIVLRGSGATFHPRQSHQPQPGALSHSPFLQPPLPAHETDREKLPPVRTVRSVVGVWNPVASQAPTLLQPISWGSRSNAGFVPTHGTVPATQAGCATFSASPVASPGSPVGPISQKVRASPLGLSNNPSATTLAQILTTNMSTATPRSGYGVASAAPRDAKMTLNSVAAFAPSIDSLRSTPRDFGDVKSYRSHTITNSGALIARGLQANCVMDSAIRVYPVISGLRSMR